MFKEKKILGRQAVNLSSFLEEEEEEESREGKGTMRFE